MKTRFYMLALLAYSHYVRAQGDHIILFSPTGDTVMTRTSCFCEKKDTLKTYFVILKNVNSNLQQLSVLIVEEPGKNSIPCADFQLVNPDTLAKYKLRTWATLGTYPQKPITIKSKVTGYFKAETNEQGYVYSRRVQHEFKIGRKVFHIEVLDDLVKDKSEEIRVPEIRKVFGNRRINRYYMEVRTIREYIDPQTRKKQTVYSNIRIIN